MNQPELDFREQGGGASQENLILQRLMAAPGQWVPMPALAHCSGSLNVHSRIACLRKRAREQHLGWQIPKPKYERDGRVIHSFYRVVLDPAA